LRIKQWNPSSPGLQAKPEFFRDPIVGVRLVLKASDLFEVPVGPGSRNAPILAFGAPDLQVGIAVMAGLLKCKQLVIASLVGSTGTNAQSSLTRMPHPYLCQAIRENCRRAEKRSADATRVKDGA
jgi:hypothetical protein